MSGSIFQSVLVSLTYGMAKRRHSTIRSGPRSPPFSSRHLTQDGRTDRQQYRDTSHVPVGLENTSAATKEVGDDE